MRRQATRKKQKTNGTPRKKLAGNGVGKDMVLVPRAFVQNAIQALTTKEEFVRKDMVVALVAELSRIASPPPPQQPQAPGPQAPPPEQQQPQEQPN